jgi:hypothetical protein
VAPNNTEAQGDAISVSKTKATFDLSQCPNGDTAPTAPKDRPLITYVYYETDFSRVNLQFFVDHGLHGAADFIFILNGPTDVDETIIFKQPDDGGIKRSREHVKIKRRNNDCYDLGAHNEVLQGTVGGDGWFGPQGPIPSQSSQPSPRCCIPKRAGKNRTRKIGSETRQR